LSTGLQLTMAMTKNRPQNVRSTRIMSSSLDRLIAIQSA